MSRNRLLIIGFFMLTAFISTNSQCVQEDSKKSLSLVKNKITAAQAEKIIKIRASETLKAFQTKDMKKISSFVHPNKGVRFSPYAFVDIENDLVFSTARVKTLLQESTFSWGYYDGSGAPIKLTGSGYFNRFIFDKDFTHAKEVGYQRIIGRGNTRNNNFEIYPQAIIVEYHFPGFDPQVAGMDWVSLRLIFEEYQGTWYLVGIVHDQWTS